MTLYEDILAAVLVGGQGSRLGGADKARLTGRDGRPLVFRLIDTLRPAVADVVLSGRPDQDFSDTGCRVIHDLRRDTGPLAGLEAVLGQTPQPWCFLVACDMPHLDASVLDTIARGRSPGVRLVIPETEAGPEPTCALYHRDVLGRVRTLLDTRRRALRGLLDDPRAVRVRLRAEQERLLTNINTVADLNR
jgi:molybdopterin-guanine dinucleotide biosynthesis protein A